MAPFEIVLLVVGVILFFVLIGILVNDGASPKALVPLFLIVVVMIGYHSIKTISYKDGAITIEKFANNVIANPQDDATASQFSIALNQPSASQDLSGNPQARERAVHALCTLAASKIILKDYPAAQSFVERAKQLDPNSNEVQFAQDNVITSKAYDSAWKIETMKMDREAQRENQRAYREFKKRADQQDQEFQKQVVQLKKQYGLH